MCESLVCLKMVILNSITYSLSSEYPSPSDKYISESLKTLRYLNSWRSFSVFVSVQYLPKNYGLPL